MRRRAVLAAILALPLSAAAQEAGAPVLVIDQDRVFEESMYGRALAQRIESAARDLATENRRIEAQLVAEERDLTERRPDLAPEEFRRLADEFDTRVQSIRTEQESKGEALVQMRDEGRQELFLQLAPVLSAILRERGGSVLLDQRSVVLSSDAIDITDEAIRRVDAAFEAEDQGEDQGEGGAEPQQ